MKKAVRIIIALVVFFFVLLYIITGLVVKWLWMGRLGYEPVFWRLLSIKWGLFGLVFVLVFLYIVANLRLIFRNVLKYLENQQAYFPLPNGTRISPPVARIAMLVIASFSALILALIFYAQWDTYIRFHWGGPFGLSDPIFGLDIGFYVFRLPFYRLIQNSLVGLTIIMLLIATTAYISFGVLPFGQQQDRRKNWTAMWHVCILFILFIGAWAWGYYLGRYELLYSTRGVVYGAGYTADNITRISLWVMFFAALALGPFILVNLFLRRSTVVLFGAGGYFVLYFLVIILLPAAVQKYKVGPSELELESPYLEHSIDFTRKAYQLDIIDQRAYPALPGLTTEQISNYGETISNIRLWDWRPTLQTYRQTQEIRLYYQFYDVDVGRYHTGKGEDYHQVLLSARELAPQLPLKARTWVNQRLQFTHGYGLVMNFASTKTEEGLPEYIIENIPPVSAYNLTVDQPAIYYGEKTPGYRIVSTKIKEFEYPRGSQNVYTSYRGTGGIPLNSFWKRILFAWTQSDINILLTSYLGQESRIQIWRQVQERIGRIAPFLKLDHDPYLVLSEGKLYWVQDAYTVSDSFPYSEPYEQSFEESFNYIRNSIKAIVDVYEGSVAFYMVDLEDPVAGAYRRAFPGLFKELEELPGDLKSHLRYPEGLFTVQADLYRTYHMTDPQVFYNREDLWAFPQEKYAGSAIQMEPYYILVRLPDERDLMYLLMTPFTPESRDNMIAWMAAKCDFPEYGKVIVYELPKERLIYGPVQIEAMIDQKTEISEQLSLWDQRGSRVIRGNLIVIPIGNSFIYVEPVYLTAEGTDIPQLKRVIVIAGNKVVMEPTLTEAINAVFGKSRPEEKKLPPPAQLEEMSRAREELEKAEKAIQKGKWVEFGEAMASLKKLLTGPP
jgi:uncharacterized membrane protein (UPF0182 family)